MSTEVSTVEEGRFRSYLDYYLTRARTQIQSNFQYRVATYMWLIGMLAEPIVYLVVWTTIAEQQGGSVQGITTGEFAAYYIVWTLVRNMNIVFTPYGWEWRIREGELSAALLRPLHPIHDDIAGFAGWKVVTIILWLPDRGRALDRVRSLDRHPRGRDRRVQRRDLGRVPDPDDVPDLARDGDVLDDARERALRARGRARAAPLRPARAAAADARLGRGRRERAPVQVVVLLPDPDPRRRPVEPGAARGARDPAPLDRRPDGLFLVVWRFAIRRYSAVGN